MKALAILLAQWAYWTLAGVAVLVAISVPKTRRRKIRAFAIVAIAFAALPSWIWGTRKLNEYTVESSCKKNRYQVYALLDGVDGHYVSFPADYRTKQIEFHFRYLIGRRAAYIEIPNVVAPDWQMRARNVRSFPREAFPYLRLYISQAGDEACDWYDTWTETYPAQIKPWIRRMGLTAEHCVAVEGTRTPASRYQVKVSETTITGNGRDGLNEIAIWIDDLQTKRKAAELQISVDHKQDGERRILCDMEESYERFYRVVPVKTDSRYLQWQIAVNDNPREFKAGEIAVNRDLDDFLGSAPTGDVAWNLISPDGSVWLDAKYDQKKDGFALCCYYLNAIVGGTLARTRIRKDGEDLWDLKALAVQADVIIVVGRSRDKKSQWLLRYSRDGEPVRSLAMVPEQLDLLITDSRKLHGHRPP